MMNRFFAGKNILITGACGDLGSQLSRRLAGMGANLALTARSKEKLDQLVSSLPQQSQISSIAADLSIPGQVPFLAEKSLELLGDVDILFNNAGVGYYALMEEVSDEKMRQLFEVNTFAPFNLIKALYPSMKERKAGKIINIVSCAGRVPIPTVGVYGGSKSALAVMTNTMRIELLESGIEMINVYPGTIDTSFERHAMRESDRSGLCPTDHCGLPSSDIAQKVLEAATGPSGEVWLEKEGKWLSVASIAWPGFVEKKMTPLLSRVKAQAETIKPEEHRRWNLWQIESSLACNLKCIMCPWPQFRTDVDNKGQMAQETWEALDPYLNDVKSIDFTGGGEPLSQKNLIAWMNQAKIAGCKVGFLSNGVLLSEEKAEKLVDLGADWLAFSLDGATRETYEKIRQGSDFDKVCRNIKYLAGLRKEPKPLVMINFVIMNVNSHEIEEIIKLAGALGINQVNFKQCDVIREDNGMGFGLFASKENKEIKQLKKTITKAKRLAKKQNITVTSFSFTPEEQPVCGQDPQTSLFIRYDGSVAPCINLAFGGKTLFLGKDAEMPTVHYGNINETDLMELWAGKTCLAYRERFGQRLDIHDRFIAESDYGHSLIKFQETLKEAIKAMPKPLKGCDVCHYLYGI